MCNFKVFVAIVGIMILAIGVCYALVSANAKGRLYDAVDDVPYCRYGLLLGTSPFEHNYYFDTRIDAAVELFKSKKIDRIIASGGDYADGCNELTAMRDSLAMKGVPADSIVLDYQGTRTVNSIVRAKELTDSVTLISQRYHNERALYLADRHGLCARAYDAETPKLIGKKIKNISREFLARVKMMIVDR
ncbi:MAG: YdcF family protein [Duncaniella sp.]|uniref:SanA/YdcF family protein n=1 Tax=Duncaniella sp. TaxID=2518496 RepID=UPI0023D005CD|nr:ElyC/SanA/YdcF family protein [Duncaniella sp.]MDE5989917.1 YdcF family protein [Duncaniella sp.]